MTEPSWKGVVLFDRERVLGWIGYELDTKVWYARTAGTIDNPAIRGEFDNEQSARDFIQFITAVEKP